MARNLILGDPLEGSWCAYGQIGNTGDDPQHILAFYKTEEEAEEAVKSLWKKFEGRVYVRTFEYNYAKDEMDLMKLMLLDGIQYLVG